MKILFLWLSLAVIKKCGCVLLLDGGSFSQDDSPQGNDGGGSNAAAAAPIPAQLTAENGHDRSWRSSAGVYSRNGDLTVCCPLPDFMSLIRNYRVLYESGLVCLPEDKYSTVISTADFKESSEELESIRVEESNSGQVDTIQAIENNKKHPGEKLDLSESHIEINDEKKSSENNNQIKEEAPSEQSEPAHRHSPQSEPAHRHADSPYRHSESPPSKSPPSDPAHRNSPPTAPPSVPPANPPPYIVRAVPKSPKKEENGGGKKEEPVSSNQKENGEGAAAVMSNEEQPETGHHLSIDEDPPPAYASQDSQENSVHEAMLEDKRKQDKDIISFSEWAVKQTDPTPSQDTDNRDDNTQTKTRKSNVNKSASSNKLTKNFASPDCTAKIISTNPESQGGGNVISSSRDEYILNKCSDRAYFVVELCESIKVLKVQMANFELYSSSPKEFRVSIGHTYPGRDKDWVQFGTFEYKDERSIQTFNSDAATNVVGKYAKVEILSHHGAEHYCPISMFKVFGIPEIDLISGEIEEEEGDEPEDENLTELANQGGDKTSENPIVKSVKTIVDVLRNVVFKSPQNSSISLDLESSSLSGSSMVYELALGSLDNLAAERTQMLEYLLATEYASVSVYLTSMPTLSSALFQFCTSAAGFQLPPGAAGFKQPQGAAGFQQPPGAAGFQQPPGAAGFQQPPDAAGFQLPSVESLNPVTVIAPARTHSPVAAWRWMAFLQVIHGEDFMLLLCNVLSIELGASKLASSMTTVNTSRINSGSVEGTGTAPGSFVLNGGLSPPRGGKNGANAPAESHVTDFVLVNNDTSKMAAKTNGANSSAENRDGPGGAATTPILEKGAGPGGSQQAGGEGATDISEGSDKGERLNMGGGGDNDAAGGRGKDNTKDTPQQSTKDDDNNSIYDKDVRPGGPVPGAQPGGASRETTWQKLANRIRALERNVTLSTGFLEELSLKYIKQIDELNTAVKQMSENILALGKREESCRARGATLERKVDSLTQRLDQYESQLADTQEELMSRHGLLVILEVCFLGLILFWCTSPTNKIKDRKPSDLHRRLSLDTLKSEKEKEKEKLVEQPTRRKSIEVGSLCTVGSMVNPLQVDREANKVLRKKNKRKRRRKEGNDRIQDVNFHSSRLKNVLEESDEDDVYLTFHGREDIYEASHQRKRSNSWSENLNKPKEHLEDRISPIILEEMEDAMSLPARDRSTSDRPRDRFSSDVRPLYKLKSRSAPAESVLPKPNFSLIGGQESHDMLLIGGCGSRDLPLIGGSGSRDPPLIGGNVHSSELFAESSPYWEKHVKDVLNSTRFLVSRVASEQERGWVQNNNYQQKNKRCKEGEWRQSQSGLIHRPTVQISNMYSMLDSSVLEPMEDTEQEDDCTESTNTDSEMPPLAILFPGETEVRNVNCGKEGVGEGSLSTPARKIQRSKSTSPSRHTMNMMKKQKVLFKKFKPENADWLHQ